MRVLTPASAPENTHWYETAGLGMFIHWGLSSVRAVGDLSWGMIKNTPYDAELNNENKLTPEEYWKQADEFDPQNYDPDVWMRAAREAGFRYAVLTTRHHDGYALWPSAFGDFNTRTHLEGRDLVAPFVEACRNNDIKVGIYYSPGDWYRERYRRSFGYADEPLGLRHEPIELPQWDPSTGMPQQEWVTNEKKKHDEEEGPYVVGQMEELLTRYGDLDVFWYDGGSAMTNERVRELQPGVMINDRGHGESSGDFSTFECRYEKLEVKRPNRPFEFCTTTIDQYDHNVTRHLGAPSWGHIEGAHYRSLALVLEELVLVNAWGGNYLLNFGPNRDGEMPPPALDTLVGLAAWMKHSGASVQDTYGGFWPEDANVPITEREGVTYLHFLPGFADAAEFKATTTPQSIRLMHTGEALQGAVVDGRFRVSVPQEARSELPDVVEVTW